MTPKIQQILNQYVENIAALYGRDLCSVILYGSYARGDNREDSDIDILILTHLDQAAIEKKQSSLSSITFDYNFDNDLIIMPIVKNIDHFNKWVQAYPFYSNIKKEGIKLYAA